MGAPWTQRYDVAHPDDREHAVGSIHSWTESGLGPLNMERVGKQGRKELESVAPEGIERLTQFFRILLDWESRSNTQLAEGANHDDDEDHINRDGPVRKGFEEGRAGGLLDPSPTETAPAIPTMSPLLSASSGKHYSRTGE
jgi:hypothetical protein